MNTATSEALMDRTVKAISLVPDSAAWREAWTELEPQLVSHEQVLVLADYALYQAKGSGRNRAVGLLPAGKTVRGGTVAPTIYINGIPASPVTTLGPQGAEAGAPAVPPAKTASASATS